MADAAQSLVEFLTRTVKKLEAEVAEREQRVLALEAFMESQREFYEDNQRECTEFFALMGGPREGDE